MTDRLKYFLYLPNRSPDHTEKMALEAIFGPEVAFIHSMLEVPQIKRHLKETEIIGIVIDFNEDDCLELLKDPFFLALLSDSGTPLLVPQIGFRTEKAKQRFPVFEGFDFIRVDSRRDILIPISVG